MTPTGAGPEAVVDDLGATPSDRMLLAFVRMWAVATLVHIVIAGHHRLDTPTGIAVAVVACVVLVRAPQLRWFLCLLIAQLADMLVEMPTSPDHWMLDGFVGLTILGTMSIRRELSLATLRAAVPGVRFVLLIAYSAAALAKYNSSFLDPVASCATALASRASFGASDSLPFTPWPIITLTTESLVVVLLVIPMTRRWGVRLGMVFHCLLTVSPQITVEDFSWTLFALFFLFLSAQDAEALLDRLQSWTRRSAIAKDVRRRPGVAACLVLLVCGFGGYASNAVASAATGVLASLVMLAVAAAAVWTLPLGAPGAPLGGVRWIHLPMLVLTLFWALNPYLGLRTSGVFTMFSNLRTEGTHGNHLFLPSVQLTSWQDDLVYVKSSNDPSIDRAGREELAIPLMTLRSQAMDDTDLTVTGVLHGHLVEFGPGPDQVHLEPLPWWQHKYTLFRALQAGDHPFCSAS